MSVGRSWKIKRNARRAHTQTACYPICDCQGRCGRAVGRSVQRRAEPALLVCIWFPRVSACALAGCWKTRLRPGCSKRSRCPSTSLGTVSLPNGKAARRVPIRRMGVGARRTESVRRRWAFFSSLLHGEPGADRHVYAGEGRPRCLRIRALPCPAAARRVSSTREASRDADLRCDRQGVKKDVSSSRALWITRRMMTLEPAMRKMVR